MPAQPVTRETDKTAGHGPYSPRATLGPGAGCSTDVFANNLGVVHVGTGWEPHGSQEAYDGDPHPYETGHVTTSGSGTVYVNNQPIARIGDAVEDDTIAMGSQNVFAG